MKKIYLLGVLVLFLSLLLINKKPEGKVLLVSPPFALTAKFTDCVLGEKEAKEKGTCLRELAEVSYKKLSPAEIENELLAVKESSELQWCHEFLHYVGWQAYDQSGSLFEAFNKSLEICDSGMYHGIAEQYIYKESQKYSPEDFIANVVPQACEEENSQLHLTQGMQGHCYHGLGHAFMILTSNNLKESLTFCDSVTRGFEESCYTGALMENIQTKQVTLNAQKGNQFAYDVNNPNYPCNTLEEKHKSYCYRYKGVYNLVLTQLDVPSAIAECHKIDPKYQSVCFWGIGTNIPGPHMPTAKAAQKCNDALPISKIAFEQCIRGALGFLVQLHLGKPEAPIEFCSVIDKNYQNYCYKESGIQLSGWLAEGETLTDKCSIFPTIEARNLCSASSSL